MYFFAGSLNIVVTYFVNFSYVAIANKLAVLIKMSRRERHNLFAKTDKVFGFARKHNVSVIGIAVKQRTYTERVACGDIFIGFCIVNNQRIFGVKHSEHIRAVFLIQRQQQFAVGIADETIPFFFEFLFQFSEPVYLAVADDIVTPKRKRLHTAFVKSHDSKSVKAQKPLARINDTGHIGASGDGLVKARLKIFDCHNGTAVPHN